MTPKDHPATPSTPSGSYDDAHTNIGLTARIVEELSVHTETADEEIPPLYESVDPDALEALCAPQAGGRDRAEVHIQFEHAGQRVLVHSDGVVDICSSDDHRE